MSKDEWTRISLQELEAMREVVTRLSSELPEDLEKQALRNELLKCRQFIRLTENYIASGFWPDWLELRDRLLGTNFDKPS